MAKRSKVFFINLNDLTLGNLSVLSVDFPIGTVQINNSTDSSIKLYRGQTAVGIGNTVPEYVVQSYNFAQMPFHSRENKVSLNFTTPSKVFDFVRVDILEDEIEFYIASNAPITSGGTGSNVVVTNAIALAGGTAHIGQVGLDSANTNIDFALAGSKITSETLSAGGGGVLGWLSEIGKRLSAILTVTVTGALPTGGNAIGTVGVTSLPAGLSTDAAVNTLPKAATAGITAGAQIPLGVAQTAIINQVINAKSISIVNMDTALTIYIGGNGVATTSGFPLLPAQVFNMDIISGSTIVIYGISASGTPKVAWAGVN